MCLATAMGSVTGLASGNLQTIVYMLVKGSLDLRRASSGFFPPPLSVVVLAPSNDLSHRSGDRCTASKQAICQWVFAQMAGDNGQQGRRGSGRSEIRSRDRRSSFHSCMSDIRDARREPFDEVPMLDGCLLMSAVHTQTSLTSRRLAMIRGRRMTKQVSNSRPALLT